MRTFYIRGSRPKDHPFPLVSWLIRFFTWSKFSHIFVCFPTSNKVFHAYFNEIKFDEPEYLNTVDTRVVFKIDVPYEKYVQLHKYCESLVGNRRGYYLQLFGVLLTMPFRLIGLKLPNPFGMFYTSMTCAEIIARGLEGVFGQDRSFYFNHYARFENLTEKDVVKVLSSPAVQRPDFKVTRTK